MERSDIFLFFQIWRRALTLRRWGDSSPPRAFVGQEVRGTDARPQRVALGGKPLDLVGVVPEPEPLAEGRRIELGPADDDLISP